MKRLRISLMLILTCAGLSAAAQSSPTGTASASVTSTIRVRIPAAATLTIPQNKQHTLIAASLPPAAASEQIKPALNRKWILQSVRLEEKNPQGDRRITAAPPVITLIHTATPE